MTFETGATTHAANDLVLTTMNEGSIYQDRLHIIRAAMQSRPHHLGMTMRDLVANIAKRERARGGKFSATAITEAARLVHVRTLDEVCEQTVSDWDGSRIVVQGYKWWDKVNGNTYSSACINIPSRTYRSGRIVHTPFAYGSSWEWDAVKHLGCVGFCLPADVPLSELPIVFADCGHIKRAAMPDGLYIAPQA